FQPIVQAERPDRPAFYEGLIRVMDRTGRIIPAREFIDVVETHEIGRKIDCAALRLGLESLAAEPALRLAINMSARSIGYKPWLQTMKRGLRNNPTVAERLILEITERSAMVMPDIVQAFMTDMQKLGIAFALDDFGAGYTAFRYLKDFYFDILKIDGGYIQGIHKNPDNQVLTKALISIARHFDMFTVAEMVDSADDVKFLTEAGNDCMQGYFFGIPTVNPYWLQDHDHIRRAG
ncbi:MAG: EAL domain-containing protein, partial [Paracoccaceae bacterium]